jgi:hypothetical protein
MSKNLPMKNNQTIKKGRGGYRQNSGRKKGAGEKLRASVLLNEIYRTNKRSFAQLLIDELNKSIVNGDTKLTAQYLQFIGNKVISDKVDVDHTTQGQPIQTVFNFPQRELTDWTQPAVAFKYESSSKD